MKRILIGLCSFVVMVFSIIGCAKTDHRYEDTTDPADTTSRRTRQRILTDC